MILTSVIKDFIKNKNKFKFKLKSKRFPKTYRCICNI